MTDPSKPDGTPRKLLDISRLTAMGWTPKIGLRGGNRWFLKILCAQRKARYVRKKGDDRK